MTLADSKSNARPRTGAAKAAPDLTIVNDLESENIDSGPKDTYLSSNGILFKLKKVPNMLIAEASRRIKMPKAPIVFIEEKEREEENPNDPVFLEELRNAQIHQGILGINTYIAFGTEVINLPEGIPAWQDESWSEDIASITEVVIPIKGKARYCAWVKFVALDDEDLTNLNIAIARFSGGIPEADVTEAEDAFRNNETRDST